MRLMTLIVGTGCLFLVALFAALFALTLRPAMAEDFRSGSAVVFALDDDASSGATRIGPPSEGK